MEQRRLDAIDGLRGLAALAVAVLHYQNLFGFPDYPLRWGELPVDLFFILSGYILSRKYEDGLSTGTTSARTFLVHRLSRMWPLHIVALTLLLGEELFAVVRHLDNFHVLGPADTPYAVLLNVLLLQCVGLYQYPNLNKPSWSISSELAINVIWMGLLIRGYWNRWVAFASVVAGTLYVYSLSDNFNISSLTNGYRGINTGLVKTALGFSLGCLLYWLDQSGFRFRRPNTVAATVILALAAILGSYPLVVAYYADFVVVLAIFPLLTLVAVDEKNFAAAFLSSFSIRWLGRSSFSIYLLHVPIANALGYLMLVGLYPSPPWTGVMFVSLVIGLSVLSYLTVEKFGISLIRRVALGRRQRVSGQVAEARSPAAVSILAR
jgi:peptidoglycan/LPS O-acetylase OafA/YrhL